VQPRLRGKSFLIRWADDFIIAFENKSDAERVMKVLPKRFERYKLNLHPEKTSLIRFSKPATEEAKDTGTFDFLGFTHYWGKGYKDNWYIKRKTSRKRLTRFLKRTWQWCKENMHELIKEQYKTLCSKLRGFYQYFGVRSNYKSLEKAYYYTYRAWMKWLSRRTRDGKVLYRELQKNYPLPKPRIVHDI
jgi:RNA-directed DNA polymerase